MWGTATAIGLGNLLALRRRIAIEEEALERAATSADA
jgi:hypothetical protein